MTVSSREKKRNKEKKLKRFSPGCSWLSVEPCIGGDPNYVTRDIAAHVRLRHRFDYAYFADLAANEVRVLPPLRRLYHLCIVQLVNEEITRARKLTARGDTFENVARVSV